MNYYKKIAEMLGVELGEEFRLKENKTKNIVRPRYKITQEEGLMYSINRNEFDRSTILLAIINGSYSVVKLPWKPKKSEMYWFYGISLEQALWATWSLNSGDFCRWKAGNCFRTEKEAETKGKEIMEQIQKGFEEE